MNKIRIGFIGCGSIARHRHVKELSNNLNVTMVAFCDIVEERAKEMAIEHGGDVYIDYKDLLKRDDIDAVFVLCCNNVHARITIDALNAGKHVLCEKPMGITEEECIQMIEAADINHKTLMIGHNQRLLPAHEKAHEIIQSGKYGKVISFRITFGHKGCEYFSRGGKATWFFKKEPSGFGTCADLGVHKADLIHFLLDEKVREVSAFADTLSKTNDKGELIEVEDNAVCLLRMQSGIMGTLSASWTYAQEDNSTTIYMENAVMKLYAPEEEDIQIFNIDGKKEVINLGGIQTNDNQFKSGIPDEFINSLIEKRNPCINGNDGMAGLKVIIACLESSKEGHVVKLNW